VELLAVLICVGFRVIVVVDDLDHPLGILELHLLLLVALAGNLLLAFPLAGRHAVTAWLLLLLLTELLHDLLDLLALLGAVAREVVHRKPWSALITVRGLARSLIAMWAMTPPSAATTVATVGAPTSGLLFLLDFFFLIFLVLSLL
jgi:hypothetical protein